MKRDISKKNESHSLFRTLGIDPGTATVGWGIVAQSNGNLVSTAYGHIATPSNFSQSQRLIIIRDELRKVCDTYFPDEAAVEKLFFFKNQKTIIEVAQARGAILLTLAEKISTIAEYTPLQVKQALTGYGRAEKLQMQHMVRSILNLPSIPRPDDVADALAIGICHMHSRKILHSVL